MNKRDLAKITGWSLILMALIAGFSLGYAFPEIYNPEHIGSIKDNLLHNEGLYKYMLLGILLIIILDLLVSYTLYHYFKNDNKDISLISTFIRIIYTIVFGIAAYFLVKNLGLSETSNELLINNFQLFQSIWNAGLIIFGAHIFLVGVLMKLHKQIPKILWYLTLFAGISYIVVHLLKLTFAQSDITTNLATILAIPMALGELGLAIWLIIRGGKEYI